MLPTKFRLIWPRSFRGEDFFVTCLYYTLHVGIHILIFFLAHLAKGNVGFWHHLASVICCLSSVNFSHSNLSLLQWRILRNEPIRNKKCLWWPCLLTDQDEMSNLYRGPSIDASYQVSVHLAKQFRRRRFLKIGQVFTF
jgi:hypothetical protein